MKKEDVRARIEELGVILALRAHTEDDALFAAEAVLRGGISIAEVSMTIPGASQVITRLVRDHPQMVVGAGSVIDTPTAQLCVDAGAQFLTSDGLHTEVIGFAVKHEILVFPGALSPTEVLSAWRSGCDFVKVVPCEQIGGARYIKSLRDMFPDIPLIAAGGINQQDAESFILAGAVAIGVGHELVPKDAVHQRQIERIAHLSQRFLEFVKSGRQQLAERRRRYSLEKSEHEKKGRQ